MMNKRKKIGGGFIPDLEEYERENQIKPKTENELDESEAYEILNLDITATFAQVKRRYRELAKKWHPDKNDSALKNEAEKKFVRINQAYETIERKMLVA